MTATTDHWPTEEALRRAREALVALRPREVRHQRASPDGSPCVRCGAATAVEWRRWHRNWRRIYYCPPCFVLKDEPNEEGPR